MAAAVRPSKELTKRIRTLVERTSVPETGRRLKLADATVARLAGGLPVTEGTALMATMRLAELSGPDPLPSEGIT